MDITLPLPPATPSRSRAVALGIGRSATGIAVFFGVVVGWFALQHWQADRSPLPGSDGRQGECAIWFVGSSTIFRWSTLERDMAPWAAHNRGIGGAKLDYVLRRFGNEHGAVRPGGIVFYGGENDLAAGAAPRVAMRHFRRFLTLKTREYGALPVVVLSLKPSPTRWTNRPQQVTFNAMLRRIAAVRADVSFVDIVPTMLVGERPGPFYDADGVHMNPRGYALWAPVVRSALRTALAHDVVDRCAGRRGGSPG